QRAPSVPSPRTSNLASRLRATSSHVISTLSENLFFSFQPSCLQPVLDDASCHILQKTPPPNAKTSRWPSAFSPTKGLESFVWAGLPRLCQSLHPPFGETCQMCHTASSFPITKSSWRPSPFRPTVMRSEPRIPAGGWRRLFHSLQPPFGTICQICHTLPSFPTAKTSCLPS